MSKRYFIGAKVHSVLTTLLLLMLAVPVHAAAPAARQSKLASSHGVLAEAVSVMLHAVPGATASQTLAVPVRVFNAAGSESLTFESVTFTLSNMAGEEGMGPDAYIPATCTGSLNDWNGDFTASVDYQYDYYVVRYDGGNTLVHNGKAGWSAVASWHTTPPLMGNPAVTPMSTATFHWGIITEYHDISWTLDKNGNCWASGSIHL